MAEFGTSRMNNSPKRQDPYILTSGAVAAAHVVGNLFSVVILAGGPLLAYHWPSKYTASLSFTLPEHERVLEFIVIFALNTLAAFVLLCGVQTRRSNSFIAFLILETVLITVTLFYGVEDLVHGIQMEDRGYGKVEAFVSSAFMFAFSLVRFVLLCVVFRGFIATLNNRDYN